MSLRPRQRSACSLGELLPSDVALESIPHLMNSLPSTKPAWEITEKKQKQTPQKTDCLSAAPLSLFGIKKLGMPMHCALVLERQREAQKSRTPHHHAGAARRQDPTAFPALEKQRWMDSNVSSRRLPWSNLLLPTHTDPGAQHPPAAPPPGCSRGTRSFPP